MPSKLHPRRLLPRLGIFILIFLGISITLSVGLSEDPPPLPESTLEIHLPDGSVETLGDILEAGLAQDETLQPVDASADPDDRDPYRLGRELADRGDIEPSIALLRSVPKDHPEYARSQRFLGWDLYTRELKQPRVGMHFIQQSIRAEPMSGNAWQDGYRALGHTMLPEGMAQYIR